MKPQPITQAVVSRFLRWTSSRWNPMRKEEAVQLVLEILRKKSTRETLTCGAYSCDAGGTGRGPRVRKSAKSYGSSYTVCGTTMTLRNDSTGETLHFIRPQGKVYTLECAYPSRVYADILGNYTAESGYKTDTRIEAEKAEAEADSLSARTTEKLREELAYWKGKGSMRAIFEVIAIESELRNREKE